MIVIRQIDKKETNVIDEIVDIHLKTFTGFFLTFLGKGFLTQLYKSYSEYKESGILVAQEKEKTIGFLAYTGDSSGLYKHMIKNRLLPFAWYSICGFVRKPNIFLRLISAFLKPKETKRNEKYIELASIGVLPEYESRGIGTKLISELKKMIDFDKYEYINLETDAIDNDKAIRFYEKNGFKIKRRYITAQSREMIEYNYGTSCNI